MFTGEAETGAVAGGELFFLACCGLTVVDDGSDGVYDVFGGEVVGWGDDGAAGGDLLAL